MRDTKIDRLQHESTGRHQGAVQRSIRNLHKNHDREERDKQRAKNEVARLNGLVGGAGTAAGAGRVARGGGDEMKAPAGHDERKRQLAQLAELGVAIPKEHRGEMALAGQWETVSERPVVKEEQSEAAKSYGVHNKRKREHEDEEDEDEHGGGTGGSGEGRKPWGSRFRAYKREDEGAFDIGALMGAGPEDGVEAERDTDFVKKEEDVEDDKEPRTVKVDDQLPPIKNEESDPTDAPGVTEHFQTEDGGEIPAVRSEEPSAPRVIFKKRKKPGNK